MSKKSAFSAQNFVTWLSSFSDADLVESVECSAVSKSLKTIKLRCFNVVGCSALKVCFHKKQHRR
ncbi:hypothetical protein CGT98_17945 [Vibrio metoecus]|nr:hypothetical protein CGT98_17945 [Vibrio metoecus]